MEIKTNKELTELMRTHNKLIQDIREHDINNMEIKLNSLISVLLERIGKLEVALAEVINVQESMQTV